MPATREFRAWKELSNHDQAHTIPACDEFTEAVGNFPNCALQRNMTYLSRVGCVINESEVLMWSVHSRWYNPLCHHCHARDAKALKLCSGCYLVWYCSATCQKLGRPKHKAMCRHKENMRAEDMEENDPYAPCILTVSP
jgi:hypothetical protein